MASRLPHFFIGLTNSDASGVHGNNKGRNMCIFGKRFFAGTRHDKRDLRERCIGDVALSPVQYPAIAGLYGDSLHSGGIGTRSRLGKAKRGNFTRCQSRQPFRFLRFSAAIFKR